MNSVGGKTPGLEFLVEKLFDHSGTFPPASKSMEEALRAAACFASTLTRPTMLGTHMVVDEVGLQTLATFHLGSLGFSPHSEIRLCLLAVHGSKTLAGLLSRIHSSQRADSVRLVVTSIEVKAASNVLSSAASLRQAIEQIATEQIVFGAPISIEPDLSGENWEELLTCAVEILKDLPGVGLKCRCTGPSGIDSNRLAHCIAKSADRELPFKVTGGLHHPIVEKLRWGNTVGFLNLAAAVSLRRHFRETFSVDAIARLLESDRADPLDTSSGLSYENYRLSFDDLSRARSAPHFSIGSCSLDEPDQDLVRLFGRPEPA